MDRLGKSLKEALEELNASTKKYEMTVYGDRPGDIAARTKRPGDLVPEKIGDLVPEKVGIIAGRELRPGDKVPCRQGDIIAGVCKVGQTSKEVEMEKEEQASRQAINTMIEEMKSKASKQLTQCLAKNPQKAPELCL